MRNVKILLVIVLPLLILSSCKKNLNQPPYGLLHESDVANKSGVAKLLIGAYSLLDGTASDEQGGVGDLGTSSSNWIYGSICGSEAYRGSYGDDPGGIEITNIERFNSIPTNHNFDAKWSAIYTGVERANTVLQVMRQAQDMSPDDTTEVRAEAVFLRAFYHFEAIKLWNKVPFVDENVTYNGGNYYLDNDTLIWPAIENDFTYAMNHLRKIQGSAVGRANKYAAEAFLVKAYMFEGKYVEAKPLLQDLILNGETAGGIRYELEKNYGDNFNIQFKNKSESVFAVQSSVNDNSGGANGNLQDAVNFPLSTIQAQVPGGCCGFFQPSQYLVNHFKTDSAGLPDVGDVKSDEDTESSVPFTPYAGTLDPRIDWVVGRRGVPYLDWGPDPGQGWIRDQSYAGPYLPKKNVYYHAQQAQFTDASFWSTGSTANNVNLIRFADVILWAAEVEARIGDPDRAREYVNMIRLRAQNPDGYVKNDDNIPYAKAVTNSQTEFDALNDPAFSGIQQYDWVVRKDLNQTWVAIQVNADGTKLWSAYSVPNYKIELYTTPWTDRAQSLKAVQYERLLEFAMEGQRFFDLVRWGIADVEINAYLQNEQKLRSYLNGAKFIKGKDEYFPIPQNAINLSIDAKGIQHLKQNPGY